MELILIRHGKTSWNALGKLQGQADPELIEEGIQQAETLAIDMKDVLASSTAIYSSERIRAMQIGKILHRVSHTPLYADSRLNSRHLGDFSGKTLEELERDTPIMYNKFISGDLNFAPPNGELANSVKKRTQNFLEMLKETYNDKARIIIITHRDNIGILHYLITGKKMKDPMRTVKNCHPYSYYI